MHGPHDHTTAPEATAHAPQAMPAMRIAIAEPNTLAAMGLRQLLHAVVPGVEAEAFATFSDLEEADRGQFVHYFVAQTMVVEHQPYFLQRLRQTLVLTTSRDPQAHLGRFKSLCVSQPEQQLARSILQLRQRGHGAAPTSPQPASPASPPSLTNREIEVLALLVRGLLNKEVADRLNISLATAVTHRKNIVEKTGLRSLAALTIYAVMHGYVDISEI